MDLRWFPHHLDKYRFQDANVIDGISPLSVTSNTIEVKNPDAEQWLINTLEATAH